MARKAKKKTPKRRTIRNFVDLLAAGPLPVPPRAPDTRTKISLIEFPRGSFPNVSPDDCGGRRMFHLSCDVFLRSADYTTHHPSSPDPSSESFEFIACGKPTLRAIAPIVAKPKKKTPKRAKRKTR